MMNADLITMNWNGNSDGSVESRGFRRAFVIREFEAGLLYRHGRLVEQIGPGRHVRWGFGYGCSTIDLRRQTFAVAGQEVLSADQVGLKVSVAVTVHVAEPLKALHEVQSWRTHLYHAVQLALRTLVASQPIETLLGQRLALGQQLLAMVQGEAALIGITVHSADVKDVMFPGELKKGFAEVLKAKQEGQAALERARGESAALRNLANAARLLESNPALQNLRLLQVLGTPGNTLVVGVPTGFASLRTAHPERRSPDAKDAEASET